MPNNVYNRLVVSGSPADVERFAAGVAGPDSSIDFERHVPTPPGLLPADTPAPAMRPGEGTEWREWRLANWGTKWNAMYPEVVEGPAASGRLVYAFTTANGPPEPWLRTVSSAYPEVELVHEYGEEFDHFAGRASWRAGELVEHEALSVSDLEWIEEEENEDEDEEFG